MQDLTIDLWRHLGLFLHDEERFLIQQASTTFYKILWAHMMTSLDFHRCSQKRITHFLKKTPNLEYLRLRFCFGASTLGGEEGLWSLISKAPKLTRLYFYHLPYSASGFTTLHNLTNLRSLDLNTCTIPGSSMTILRPLTNLVRLSLDHCQQMSEVEVAYLAPLTNLQHLSIFNNKLPPQAFKTLGSLTQLVKLGVATNPVTDASLLQLRQLTRLTAIDLSYCELIQDGGMAHLACFKNLTSLTMTYARSMTRAGLAKLSELENLVHLDLSFCSRSITRDLVKEILPKFEGQLKLV